MRTFIVRTKRRSTDNTSKNGLVVGTFLNGCSVKFFSSLFFNLRLFIVRLVDFLINYLYETNYDTYNLLGVLF